jgi:hypothetical protein
VHRYPYLTDMTAKVVAAKCPIPASPLGAVLFIANAGHQCLEAEADEFLEGVKTGENLNKGDPRLTLREWFYAQRARERGVIGTELAFAAIGRAWNGFAQRRELSILKQLYGPNRRTLPLYDFDPTHFQGIEDVAAKMATVQTQNLAQAPQRRQA